MPPLSPQQRLELVGAPADKNSKLVASNEPQVRRVLPASVEQPLVMNDFEFRSLDGVRHMLNLIDIVPARGAGAFDVNDLERILHDGSSDAIASLPDALRAPPDVPEGTKLQLVPQQVGETNYNLLRHFVFKTAVKTNIAQKFVRGVGHTLPPAPDRNTWGQRQSLNAALDRLPGLHARYWGVEKKGPVVKGGGWQPTEADIRSGFAYLREHFHEIEGASAIEAQEWVLLKTKTPGLPTSGWPMAQIEKALANMDRAQVSADVDVFSPTTSFDMKGVIRDVIMWLIWAFAPLSGPMVLGVPGVGKTPLCEVGALGWGRYLVDQKFPGKVAAFRRGKQIDVFRDKSTPAYEGILLDDAALSKIDVEDTKSFGTSHKAGHSDCRYTPSKWAKGGSGKRNPELWFGDADVLAVCQACLSGRAAACDLCDIENMMYMRMVAFSCRRAIPIPPAQLLVRGGRARAELLQHRFGK